MKPPRLLSCLLTLTILCLAAAQSRANLPGGGTNGPNVTLTDGGSTVTLSNGNVSILCNKSGANLTQINYTFNNNGSTQTLNLLSGGNNGGQLYWENSSSEGLTFNNYTVVANPANNGGNYAEISMITTSVTGDALEVHFSMLRGSTGFYTTAIYSHASTNGAFGMGECRDNIYSGSIFNWMSVDANRNRLMEVSGGSAIAVQGAPKEVSLWTSGLYAGQYEDKYKYSADLGINHVWGWSSVGTGGKNVGLWNVSASSEYYNGGPLKRELMSHIGTTILNMLNGGHYGMGSDGNFTSGEVWNKVYGPYFIYCNNVTNTITGTNAPAQALYTDALAQAAAEQTAWPYYWFTNANYAPASNRGNVTGKFTINDSGNPNASAANLWVGIVQQPVTSAGYYDFQQWMKPYQFWTKTDANGNFTITNAIAGANYTLYAFGPGAPDTFLSQSQTGGSPPIIVDLPASPFAVSVPAGGSTNLGTVTWTPSRVGSTVFEIGYPDRVSDKFRHGDDWWVGDIGPSSSVPSPIWSKWLEYPFDFPNGVNYTVGQSRWTTDWNFIQPVVTDSQGNYNSSSSTITFNLPSAPTGGAQASIYLGLSSDYDAAPIISVNGVNAGNMSGLTGTPNNSIPTTGYYTGYNSSDTSIREGNNGAFSDERLTFPASYLHAGQNTININIRQEAGAYFANHAMYDYVRLELTGYVPPAPASVIAYAGNNCNLVTWPVTPGATSYNILRSTTAGSGYTSITNGVIGPVCGSGANNATYLDTTAANGTTYYYVVQSVNPTGSSANSSQSSGTTPSAGISASAPATPTGLSVSGSGHQSVTLSWSASTGANYYSVWRSVLTKTGGGSSNTLNTIILNNNTTNTTYTDISPTDGSIYRYYVTATSAGGTSGNSTAVAAVPLPSAPATAPPSVLASFVSTTNIILTWTAVPGAVGYTISRATSASGPYTYLQTVTETTYTDYGLSPTTIYYYRVAAMNAAAASANVTDSVNSQQSYPPTLTASGTNAAVMLSWTAPTGATSYTIKRGTSVGGETTTVISGYTGLSYTNTGLANGTTYYYVVTATGSGGASGNSPEASATPFSNNSGIWISTVNGLWSTATNWNGNNIASGPASSADFSTLALPTNVTVTLDSARSLDGLKFGDTASSYNWTLAGTNTLTLGTTPAITVVNDSATINTPLAGSSGLTKSGAGNLVLGGATNTFTGGVTVNTGTLELDFTPATSPVTNIAPAANALTLAGGTLQINGSSNSTQSFASTTLNPGLSLVSAGGSNAPVGNLATFTANAGGAIEFIGPATIGSGGGNIASNANLTTTASGNGAFLGGNGAPYFDALYATVGQYDFAATVGTSSPYTVVGGSQIAGFYTAASGTAGSSGNLDVTGSITGWSAQPYLTSLRFNTDINGTVSVAATGTGSTLTLDDILVTPNVGPYNVSLNSGSLRPAGGSTSYAGPYVLWQNNPAGELIVNSTLGNSKVAGAAYVQSGPGTVSITGTASGYSGQSYLNGGVTLIAGNGSIGASASGMTVNLNGGTLAANGTFTLDNAGANLRPINLLANGGGLAAIAGNTLTVDGLVSGAGTLAIGIPASSANGNTAGRLPGTGPGTANAAVTATGTVILTNANTFSGGTVIQSGTLNINGIYALGGANYAGLTFNGGNLQYAANLTGNNGSSDLTSIGTAGITLATNGAIDLNGNTVTYANAMGNNGAGALTIRSSLAGGALTLLAANNYSGGTAISNATLIANNTAGSATGSGDITVQNAGVISGNGSLAGSVTVLSGGTLAVGNTSDSLSIGNNLTLNPGSLTTLQIQHSPLTNSSVNVAGTLAYGGTLIVTNLNGTLANGDSFQLFNAPNISGNFANLVLPALATGLAWNTNNLATSGALAVVATNTPSFTSSATTGTSLILNGSGGVGNANYYVLATTNLNIPLANWTIILTNQFDASGNFTLTLTNALSTTQPNLFYRLQLQ